MGGTTPIQSFFHEQSSLNSPCVVQPGTAAASANLYCILDVAEEDLYANSLNLNFNSPAGMCPYTVVRLYSFYQYDPGTVQSQAITVHVDGSGNCLSVAGGSFVSGGCAGVPYCQYDYTPVRGPNCCTGTATITTISPTSTTSSVYDFTGNQNNCISGPGPDLFGRGGSGAPMGKIYRTYDAGVNQEVSIYSPLEREYQSNLYVANYFNPMTFGDSQQAFPPTADANYPVADPAPDLSPASPYYEIACTDQAADTIARIRVLVRPWDRVSDFNANTNPYDPGAEPVFGGPFHDYNVWQDLAGPNFFIGLGL